MDKVLKLVIILGVALVSISISYYLVIFLPSKEKARVEQQIVEKEEDEERKMLLSEREKQEKLEKCFRDAKEFHEKYKKEEERDVPPTFVLEPQFFYNSQINRCLYSGGYNILLNEINHFRVIKDVYTNETLARLAPSFIDGKSVIKEEDSDRFWKMHDVLMTSSNEK